MRSTAAAAAAAAAAARLFLREATLGPPSPYTCITDAIAVVVQTVMIPTKAMMTQQRLGCQRILNQISNGAVDILNSFKHDVVKRSTI